jgi:hypothetical protein
MAKYFKDSEAPKVSLQGVIDMLFETRQAVEAAIKKDDGPSVVNLPSGAKLTGEGADMYLETLRTYQQLLGTAVYHLERLPEAGNGDIEGLKEAVREAMDDDRPSIPAEDVHNRLELRHEDRLNRNAE